ncbi:hypothetical protein H632_c1372p0 [Helicosporidium sp. ATCC 50920]|nr:hypothetical protein H632_c1372p0 [Helicosporidium sp. ATCC 50920]|eukprot:KDD74359.1 hypothetical protein H632_c1372p0 [Helicosporidium sp. ATCC 50920]
MQAFERFASSGACQPGALEPCPTIAKVLGVPADSDSETIRKTYKRRLAETRDDPRARQAIEDAHSRLVMAALSSRLSGKMKVDRAVRYADRAAILPWRPRLCRADGPTILLSSLIQAGMLVWALSAPSEATTQPVVWSLAFGGIGNVVKQNKLFPPPAQSDYEAAGQGQGIKNLLRGAFLAVLATLAGVLVAWTLPDLAASLLDADLPDWFYGAQFVLLAFGATLSNGLMTAFFR